ncbi:MAG: SAM-dependent methyltransferase [Rubrivivax sp.]|nr:SAM-dependent methyltransferase [Rubrivivax sp.]
MRDNAAASVSTALFSHLSGLIDSAGGWLPFDRCMEALLYTPGLGYYARDDRQFGPLPGGGSDFVTAPELSPLFGQALAVQLAQALEATGTDEIWEFGAGSGALARQLLQALGSRVRGYHIVDLSAVLRQRQARTLAGWADRVQWHDRLPERFGGVVVGNEVLDAMPVQLLHFDGTHWFERGVTLDGARLQWADRPTALRPPGDAGRLLPGTVTEIHPQAEAFVRTLAARLERGAAFFVDYGFPEHEYYHPQRQGGTLMAHRAHVADTEVLADPGTRDITAHVNFSAVALAAQDAGLAVLGYTSQGRFLINCGLPALMAAADVRAQVQAQPLILEHEMGELFKVIGLAAGGGFEALGFASGDRSHTL